MAKNGALMPEVTRRKTEDYLRLQASSNTWNGDLGRKGEVDQREATVGNGVDVRLRTRSPSASCPAMVREMNNSNDVWSPGGGVGEIMYEPRCLHSDVLAAASITNLGPSLFEMAEFLSRPGISARLDNHTSKQRRQQCLATAHCTHGLR